MILLQKVCKEGMSAANTLEYQGLPNLYHLANLREQLVLFRLYSYEYLFAPENQRAAQEQAVNATKAQIHAELTDLKSLHYSAQGQQLTATLEESVGDLSQAFDQMRRLTDKDFAAAMNLLDHSLPAKIQAVNEAAAQLDQFGYQRSDDQANANFHSFGGIKNNAILFGAANIVVTLGLTLFVVIAARKTHRQLAGALEQIHDQDRKLRLQASALNAAANAIVITNREGLIEWANPAFSKLTGYTVEEVLGKKPNLLKSDAQPLQFYGNMWKTIQAGEVWNGELINRRKDGTLYNEEMNITPVRDENGVIQNFIAIKHDISNRMRIQQELEQEKKLLCSLMDNLPDYIFFKDRNFRFTRINLALSRQLGLTKPQDAIGKTDTDFSPWHEVRQRRVDEERMILAGQAIVGLVEKLTTPVGVRWVSSTKVPLRDETGQISGMVGASRDITDYKQVELERMEIQGRYQMLFESSAEAILISDEKGLLDINPAALKTFRYPDKAEVMFRPLAELSPPSQPDGVDSRAVLDQKMAEAFRSGSNQFEFYFQRQNGELFPAAISLTGFQQGSKKLLQASVRDLTESKRAEKERQLMEVQLRQSQKLESIGQLAAGIAHEINTPTQYVGDNTRFLQDAFNNMVAMLRDYDHLLAAAKTGPLAPEQIAKLEAAFASRDIEFLYAQIPTAIQETLEGVDRVSKIVRAMKEFSHPGGKEKTASNLNKAIESTVTVARNEWKYVADLDLDLDPNLPLVPCFLGEFNQAILNLIVNAAHAIGDVVRGRPGAKGHITVRSRCLGDRAEIRVTDTGTGIEEKYRAKIFEPFFTTKEVGQGTGQGLTVVYSNIVKKHGGTVTFETEVGHGTTLIIRLPLNSAAAEPAQLNQP
jgi:PAS domain S-box-containing protein